MKPTLDPLRFSLDGPPGEFLQRLADARRTWPEAEIRDPGGPPIGFTGSGLSGIIARWTAEERPGRWLAPGSFVDPDFRWSAPLIVFSQNLSHHARLALNHPGVQGPVVVVSEAEPPAADVWLRLPGTREGRLRLLGPWSQVHAARHLLRRPAPTTAPGAAVLEPPPSIDSGLPRWVLHSGPPEAALAARLLAWSALELSAEPVPWTGDPLECAHGPLHALMRSPGPVWAVVQSRRQPLIQRLRACGVGAVDELTGRVFEDWWRAGWSRLGSVAATTVELNDGPLYGLSSPLEGMDSPGEDQG
jgi:hypothetical protein